MAFTVESQTTQISNIFIDEYMPKAHPPYVLIYLYAYRHIVNGNNTLTNQSIAEALDFLESDVLRCWKYWQKQGIISLSEDGSVHFLPIVSKKQLQQKNKPKPFTSSKPSHYTQEEMLAIGTNSPTAKKLFSLAESYLGRTLSYNDMNIVLSFHEWLGLSLEVIELLFTYCSEIKHCHLSYIEKTAIGWAEEGITTPERALEYIKQRRQGYSQIMKAFGQGSRMPAPAEEKYIKKWFSQYQLPIEIITIACEKTILQIGKLSFAYADKILQDWHKENIKTPEDIKKSDEKYQSAKQTKKKIQQQSSSTQQTTTVKQNRFVNYEQRQWNFEELERLERERLQKK